MKHSRWRESLAAWAAMAVLALAMPVWAQRAMPFDPASRQAMADALRAHVRPMQTPADLTPLIDWIGERRCVLLGEASHGTQEYYQWRAALSKRLIVEKGFQFIAVEGDWGACMAVNRYVKHLEDAPASATEALSAFNRWPGWMWNNQPTLELIEWMRAYNAQRPPDQRVGFYGIDVYGMPDSLDKTVRYLRQLSPELAAQAEQALGCLDPFRDDMHAYVRSLAQQQRDSCEPVLMQLLQQLHDDHDTWQLKNPHAYFHAEQNLLVVLNAERHHRKMLLRDGRSWNARANHFYLTFERLLAHAGPDARGIVWAHNTHVGDARATGMRSQGMVNIGQLARESLGPDQVAILGFGTYEGEVVAGQQWGDPQQTMSLPRAAPGSLEQLLYQASDQPGLYLMDELKDIDRLDGYVGHRAVGVVYNPRQEQGNYAPTLWPQRYDAFIFLPRTTALQPVKRP